LDGVTRLHRITSSARSTSDSGILIPTAFAAGRQSVRI